MPKIDGNQHAKIITFFKTYLVVPVNEPVYVCSVCGHGMDEKDTTRHAEVAHNAYSVINYVKYMEGI